LTQLGHAKAATWFCRIRLAPVQVFRQDQQADDHCRTAKPTAENEEKLEIASRTALGRASYPCTDHRGEGIAKDYEFSRRTMEEHWQTGYDDAVRTLSHPEVLQRPDKMEGVRTFDFTQSDGKRN
jgi:Patatin phospholipase